MKTIATLAFLGCALLIGACSHKEEGTASTYQNTSTTSTSTGYSK